MDWARPMQGEGPLALRAFQYYRDLNPLARCVEDVALDLGPANEEITVEVCEQWRAEFLWDARACRFDAWRDEREKVRREIVADARAKLRDREGWIGASLLVAAEKRAEAAARAPDGIEAKDVPRIAKAARELLLRNEEERDPARDLGDLLAKLDPDRLDTLLEILAEAGVSPEDL